MNTMEGGEPTNSNNNIIGNILKFDEDTQNELFNIAQYSLLSVPPILLLNRSIQKLIPDADEEKGSVEVLAEVVGQILFMFFGMFLIHRVILAVPTYSKIQYQDFNVTNVILSFLIIILSLHTKLGEKTNILIDRLFDMIEGKNPEEEKAKQAAQKEAMSSVIMNGPQQAAQATQAQSIVNAINGGGGGGSPSFNDMYGGPAISPTVQNMDSSMLLAANEALGGSFGGSAF